MPAVVTRPQQPSSHAHILGHISHQAEYECDKSVRDCFCCRTCWAEPNKNSHQAQAPAPDLAPSPPLPPAASPSITLKVSTTFFFFVPACLEVRKKWQRNSLIQPRNCSCFGGLPALRPTGGDRSRSRGRGWGRGWGLGVGG